MHQALEGLEGVEVIADDILIYGKGDSKTEAIFDHDKNLQALLERCRKLNIKLNKDKVQLRKSEIQYIGHLLTSEGVKPDPRKVSAITSMPSPRDKAELKRFLGMVAYL